MFKTRINDDATPIRVYNLCSLASKDQHSLAEARQKLYPAPEDAAVFTSVSQVARELELIENDKETIKIVNSENIYSALESITKFRRYCNKRAFVDKDDLFFRVSSVMLKIYDIPETKSLIKDSFTSSKFVAYMSNRLNMVRTVQNIRNWRFWASFLGLGLVHNADNRFCFLPNMYTNLLDSIENAKLADGIYTIADFIERLSLYISEALPDNPNDHHLCLGLSNGLRSLHDNGHITLSHELDAKEVWYLTEMPNHSIPSTITHVRVNRGAE